MSDIRCREGRPICAMLHHRIEQLEAALQEVWDCEDDSACPNCKLIARAALEDKDDE